MPTPSIEQEAQEFIVQKLDMIRARRGITRTKWAELAGVSRPSIYRALGMYKGRSVSYKMVRRLANVLDVSLSSITPKSLK